jgi:hypothetical protein
LLDTPEGTAFRQVADYMQNLQMNDCIARPQGWAKIIYQQSSAKEQPPSQHPWQRLRSDHYCIVATHEELKKQLDSGLCLPVVITPESALGQEITTQCSWSKQPVEKILDEIFAEGRASIQVILRHIDFASGYRNCCAALSE